MSTEVRAPHHTTHHAWESSQIPICPQHSIFSHKSHKSHFPQFSIFSLPPHPSSSSLLSSELFSSDFTLLKLEAVFEIFQLYVENDDWSRRTSTTSWRAKNCVEMEWTLFIFEFLKLIHPFNFTPWCLTLFVVHVEEFGGTGSVWITSEDIRDFNYSDRTITYTFGRLLTLYYKIEIFRTVQHRMKSHI